MYELMWQQIGSSVQFILIREIILSRCIQTGLMMFDTVMEGLVAERDEKMIMVVMGSGKQCSGLRHQVLVLGHLLGGQLQSLRTKRHYVHFIAMCRVSAVCMPPVD